MTSIGYFLASEQFDPKELVDQAKCAEQAGFEQLWIRKSVETTSTMLPDSALSRVGDVRSGDDADEMVAPQYRHTS